MTDWHISKDKCEEDRDFYAKMIPIAGFIMFVAGLWVGNCFLNVC